ncbi:MAG: 4Fe-4S dicluster domain-containing protein [Syntrophales bacterium]
MNRREFLKLTAKGSVALTLAGGLNKIVRPLAIHASPELSRWVFLVDTYKCIGCGFCVKACKLENEIPFDADISRTWVERYVVTKQREVFADTPKEARYGFTSGRIDLGRGKYRDIADKEIDKAFFVPKLCNQCEKPSCVQVCPVGATYQAPDGIVMVDRKWCIGCGYCIMACPYGMRFFHPVYYTADKCNFCYHRISRGMETACVQACPTGARSIGNIKDSADPVTKIIMTKRVSVHKPEYGTDPQVYFIGLSEEVR